MALHVRIQVPALPEALEAVAEGLVCLNVVLMRHAADRGVDAPALYESGVVYRREPPGREWWQSSLDVLGVASRRSGDCEDLAAYRAAEMRLYENNHARVRVVPTTRGSYHAVVEHEDGTIEDPSRILVDIERERKDTGP